MKKELITAAAIKVKIHDDTIYIKGIDHFDCIRKFVNEYGYEGCKYRVKQKDQGFWTTDNKFVDRAEAYTIAKEGNQLIKDLYPGVLFSEFVKYEPRKFTSIKEKKMEVRFNDDYDENDDSIFIIPRQSEDFIKKTPYGSKEILNNIIQTYFESHPNDEYRYTDMILKKCKGFPLYKLPVFIDEYYNNSSLISIFVNNPGDILGIIKYINNEYAVVKIIDLKDCSLLNDKTRITCDCACNANKTEAMYLKFSIREENE